MDAHDPTAALPGPQTGSIPGVPRVTVVIPVKDDPSGIRECVTRLQAQTYPAALIEVVVVDNGSTPALRAEDLPGVVVLREPAPGSYAARNAGVGVASGDVIAFTDADCRPRPDWIEAGVAALQAGPAAVVAGDVTIVTRDPGERTGAELYDLRHAFPQRDYVRELGFGVTANVLTWRQTLEEVGPFDGSLASGGDREWGGRVTAAGLGVAHSPDAVVEHPARRTLSELRRKVVRTHRGDAQLRARVSAGRPVHRLVSRAVPPLKHVGRSLRDVDLSPAERVRYVTAYLVVRYTHVWCDLREVVRPTSPVSGRRGRPQVPASPAS